MSAAEWVEVFEDLVAEGLADVVTFGAISQGMQKFRKVRTMLRERSLVKKNLQLIELRLEKSPLTFAIIEYESQADEYRTALRKFLDRITNPHTEVVTTEGIVVKVPKEGNLHLMESHGNSGGTTKKTWRKVKETKAGIEKPNVKVKTPKGELVEVPVKNKDQIKGKMKVTEDFTIKTALPEKVITELANYKAKQFRFGEYIFKLTKEDIKHILERHVKTFWNGTFRDKQTFLPKNMKIKDIENAIFKIMQKNRDIIIKNGTNINFQINGTYKGVDYLVGFKKGGKIRQFY